MENKELFDMVQETVAEYLTLRRRKSVKEQDLLLIWMQSLWICWIFCLS